LHAARAWLHSAAHATDATNQATDLGGLGNASGGRPGNGGARGIPSCADIRRSGIQNDSGASAAPQQAMPAPPPQQLLPHGVTTPVADFAESRVALTAIALAATVGAATSCARISGGVGTACVARGA
jgi:hypothetical protein